MSTWTPADDAELDCLVWELVNRYFDHRDDCQSCQRRYPPCPAVGKAISTVIEWRKARGLLSRAEALRIDQKLHSESVA